MAIRINLEGFNYYKKIFTNMSYYLAFPLIVIILWQLVSNFGIINPISLPSPIKILEKSFEIIKDGSLARNIASSIKRVIIAYGIASFSAIILGLIVGWSKIFEKMTDIIIQILKPIPPIAWIPLAILWFGIGEGSKLFIIAIGSFFPIFVNVVEGIRNIDSKYIEVASLFKISLFKLIFKVLLPGALPAIMTGLRVGLGVAWVCVVAAELIAAESGIGYLIMDARSLAQSDTMIVGMLTIGIIGKIMDTFIKKVEKIVVSWK